MLPLKKERVTFQTYSVAPNYNSEMLGLPIQAPTTILYMTTIHLLNTPLFWDSSLMMWHQGPNPWLWDHHCHNEIAYRVPFSGAQGLLPYPNHWWKSPFPCHFDQAGGQIQIKSGKIILVTIDGIELCQGQAQGDSLYMMDIQVNSALAAMAGTTGGDLDGWTWECDRLSNCGMIGRAMIRYHAMYKKPRHYLQSKWRYVECPRDIEKEILLWAKVMQPLYFKYYSMVFYFHEKS